MLLSQSLQSFIFAIFQLFSFGDVWSDLFYFLCQDVVFLAVRPLVVFEVQPCVRIVQLLMNLLNFPEISLPCPQISLFRLPMPHFLLMQKVTIPLRDRVFEVLGLTHRSTGYHDRARGPCAVVRSVLIFAWEVVLVVCILIIGRHNAVQTLGLIVIWHGVIIFTRALMLAELGVGTHVDAGREILGFCCL